MAFKVVFKGFVHEVRDGKFGVEVVVKHATKKPDGKGGWETVRTDFVSVSNVDNPRSYTQGDLVEVTGTISQTAYNGKDGEAKLSLRVRAESVVKAPVRGVETRPAAPVTTPEDDWALPF